MHVHVCEQVLVEADVEVDTADILAAASGADDDTLEQFGLQHIGDDGAKEAQWRAVANALREGDRHTLINTLSDMAWSQSGVVIPVVGLRRIA